MNLPAQFLETVKNSQNILLTTPREMEQDAFCGTLALFYTLNKLSKNVNLMIPKIVEKLRFLASQEILESINQGNIVISINTKGERIEKVVYEKNANELKFNLDLKNGNVKIENLAFKIRENADFIINVEKNNFFLENKNDSSLQKILQENDDTGISEKIIDLLKSVDENLIDKNVATCLLAGIVSSTQNFQNKNSNNLLLEKASYLVERGADYQKIIQFLYKTKSLSEIKLLGIVLSKIDFNKEKSIAFCPLSKEDFTEINSSSKELSFVLEALKNNFSIPKTIIFLWEGEKNINGLIYSSRSDLLKIVSDSFRSVGKKNCALFTTKDSNIKISTDNLFKLLNIN